MSTMVFFTFVKTLIMLKRTILILLLLPMFHVYGQFYQFTIRFNPVISWFNSDNKTVKPNGNRLGIDGGLDIDRFFAERYAITTGLSIGGYGGELKTTSNVTDLFSGYTVTPDKPVTLNLKYLSIPLGLKFKTEEIGYSTFYAQIGFIGQVCLRARAYSDDPAIDGSSVMDDINIFNLGYQIGGGLEYSITRSTALVGGLIYTSFFTDALASDKYSASLSNLAIRLGIRF